MFQKKPGLAVLCLMLFSIYAFPQVKINEGSNKNYSSAMDEDSEYPDWIELYNHTGQYINLEDFSLTDKESKPRKWVFPEVSIEPGGYKVVFCSGKDRIPVPGFTNVVSDGPYSPQMGWNTHQFSIPFYWDGESAILINTCSYNGSGYTSNSVFNQTQTDFFSTLYIFQDGSDAVCNAKYGTPVNLRPNMKLNGKTIGYGNIQNNATSYPAPYGNWYWCARHQMLILPSELTAAGISSGYINSIAFDVASTDPNTVYDYFNISLKLVEKTSLTSEFEPNDESQELHTNFKISSEGEKVYLFSPGTILLSSLDVDCYDMNSSVGSSPDGTSAIFLFQEATPGITNNNSQKFTGHLDIPTITIPSGYHTEPFAVEIDNPNGPQSEVYYTLDGSDPTTASFQYDETIPVEIDSTTVIKAKAFEAGILPSKVTGATYFFDVNHTTPVISIITDNANLYGEQGIFDNWWQDWERPAYIDYFDSTQTLIFSQRTGIQMDGGWGGSRHYPQHSFRVELDEGVLGGGVINYKIIPDRPERTKYSKFYLRNGSNQYLTLPYKDACGVTSVSSGTNNYYSAFRPVSVYINGSYFGLYELREKMDAEYFEVYDGADPDKLDILSQSAWYNGVLRPVEGSVQPFYNSLQALDGLYPDDSTYWDDVDNYFDMQWYTDYIIGVSWIANIDWPWNNIKIYRSDATGYRWRYCLIDVELALQPNGWTDKNFDFIDFMLNYDPNNPYLGLWQKSIKNERFRNYFINRYADLMNTVYLQTRVTEIESNMYSMMHDEMYNEFERWGDPENIPAQMEAFQGNHLIYKFQLMGRSAQVRNHLMYHFGLPNTVNVTLDVYPPESGYIKISTVTPSEYPWTGKYFNGIPVEIIAYPAEGFSFLYWEGNGLINDTLNSVFLDTLNAENVTFMAVFEDMTTGISNNSLSQKVQVYPNPARSILHVVLPNHSNATYRITDVNGRIKMEGKFESSDKISSIDVSRFEPSVYLLHINDKVNGIYHSKFIKIQE